MLFSAEIFTKKSSNLAKTAETGVNDAGNITLGGGYRLPVQPTASGKIILGGEYRQPTNTVDSCKIRLGGGYRLPLRDA
jgi:hypothetical protein